MTSKYLGTFDKNARNCTRKKKQRKPKTKMRNDITDSEIRLLLWHAAALLAEWRRTGIHFAETSQQRYNTNNFVGRNVHICWPKHP